MTLIGMRVYVLFSFQAMFTHERILRARVERASERIVLHTRPSTTSALCLSPHGDVLRAHDGIVDTGRIVCRSSSRGRRG